MGERVEADNGYRGESGHIDVPNDCVITGTAEEVAMMRRKKAVVRARHETINRRFKQFNCLKQVYRHNLDDHSSIFFAVVVLTQIGINQGEYVWNVEY